MKIKAQIPNAVTLINLLVGVIGIIKVLDGDIVSGAYFVLLAAFFDFIDGLVARLLKVQSEMGKQLDSLADVVSFGVLPGVILYMMVKTNSSSEWLPYLTLIVPMLSAFRLAKFNLDTRQSDRFIGLPTPANALFISTLPHLLILWPELSDFLTNPWFLVSIAWIFSILLLIELPLIALKFKNFSFSQNVFRYALVGLAMGMSLWLGLAGIPLIILAYIGLSMIENSTSKE